MGIIDGEWDELLENIDNLWGEYSDGAVIVYV